MIAGGEDEIRTTPGIGEQPRQLVVARGVGGDDGDVDVKGPGGGLDGCSGGIERGNLFDAIGPSSPLDLLALILIRSHRDDDDLGPRPYEHLVDTGRGQHRDDPGMQDRPIADQNLT